MTDIPYFKVPLNLPHAGAIASRIHTLLSRYTEDIKDQQQCKLLYKTMNELFDLLVPYKLSGIDPPLDQAQDVQKTAANLGRTLVDEIERLDLGQDRLGQCVRNLFECLELGKEGAILSLRAGENPESAQRPI